jgi:hypothetical protein
MKNEYLEQLKFSEKELELLSRLTPSNSYPKKFEYGQLRSAAFYALIHFGAYWINPNLYGSIEISKLRGRIKFIVMESAVSWHGNKSQVWRRFRNHAVEILSAGLARDALMKAQVNARLTQ